jgi:outer membrane immunogenic protein
MMRSVIAGVGLLAMAGSMGAASAADLPAQTYTKAPAFVAPVYDWSGFYLGINGGGGASHGCWSINNAAGVPVPPASEGCNTATGGLVGGQVGYRWQSANWVFGVEAQGDWADFKGSNASLVAIIPYNNQTKIDAIGLFTGQIGYAWNSTLLYVKGGAAVTDNSYSSSFPVSNVFAGAGVPWNASSDTRWGGTVGVGLEFGFAPNWSVGFEYDHLFMGNDNITFAPTSIAVGRADNIGEGVDIGTIRLDYRFGGGAPIIAKY